MLLYADICGAGTYTLLYVTDCMLIPVVLVLNMLLYVSDCMLIPVVLVLTRYCMCLTVC